MFFFVWQAQQLRLERVDKIAKGYVPVKDLSEGDTPNNSLLTSLGQLTTI